ncbi:MAG: hypothetical protein R3F55_23935 [Alphaproteobacteria bacterium]
MPKPFAILLAVLLALPAAGAGAQPLQLADTSEDARTDAARPTAVDAITYRAAIGLTGTLTRLYLVTGDAVYGADLAGRLTRVGEDRISLQAIPLLGDVQGRTYSRVDFGPANSVGSVGIAGSALVVNIGATAGQQPWLSPAALATIAGSLHAPGLPPVDAAGQLDVTSIVIFHGDYSYRLAAALVRPVAAGAAAAAPAVVPLGETGGAYRSGDELLVEIKPAIITGY